MAFNSNTRGLLLSLCLGLWLFPLETVATTFVTQISSATPSTPFVGTTLSVGRTLGGDVTQALIRFDRFPPIPAGTEIVSANLHVRVTDPTNGDILGYRITNTAWDASSTWNSLVEGISVGEETLEDASFRIDSPGNIFRPIEDVVVDVTADVDYWMQGESVDNHGWVLVTNSLNRADLDAGPEHGPYLTVTYKVVSDLATITPTMSPTTSIPNEPGSVTFEAIDTEIASGTPDVSYGSATFVGVDQEDRGGRTQGLLQFLDMALPPGTMLTSATLSLVCDSATDGTISFHRMLRDWSEDSTWNSLGGGVQTNDVEARSVASTTLSRPVFGLTYTLDVTDDVRLWLCTCEESVRVRSLGWVLRNDSRDGFDFLSSESDNGPILELNYRVDGPTLVPSQAPSLGPIEVPPIVYTGETYVPGNLTVDVFDMDGRKITLSAGMGGRAIAKNGRKVPLVDGTESDLEFHPDPDAAGVFPATGGGFYYASNAESSSNGGVGVLEFDAMGEVVDYFRTLSDTKRNCGGGKTPWGTWVTCEENGDQGRVWQTDPSGVLASRRTEVVESGGNYESFAYWIDGVGVPHFYTTEDTPEGALVHFVPDAAGLACFAQPTAAEKWCTLESGTYTYLRLDTEGPSGTFSFGTASAATPHLYPNAEGIDVVDGILYFCSKVDKTLFAMDLEAGTFLRTSTLSGAFNLQPDQLKAIASDPNDIIYFCEDGGSACDVHGRNSTSGEYFTIVRGDDYNSETTGLGFSPDAKFMFVSFQRPGVIWQFWRQDGDTFRGPIVDIKYHNELAP